jgi:hypothetical protein
MNYLLTVRHIEIHKAYGGDGDAFVRCASDEENFIMKYEDWALIEDLLHDIYLLKNTDVSQDYREKVFRRIAESCEDEQTVNELLNSQTDPT